MQRVYLDQNKWIDLARARTGHQSGKTYTAAYKAARAAVEAGRASFPLSSAHYFETHKQGVARRRLDLAQTMRELSRFDAIAPPHVIVSYEVEVALIKVLELPNEQSRSVKVFGRGANHAHGTTIFTYTAPEQWEGHILSPTLRAFGSVVGQASLEFMILSDAGFKDSRINLNERTRLTGTRFVDGQNRVRDSLLELGRHRLGDMMTGTAIRDVLDILLTTAERMGAELDRLLDGGREAFVQLLEAMPSRWVEKELRRIRQLNPQKAWEGNDLNDVTALSIAVPYCDAVITERGWSAMINGQKINRPFGTRVLADLRKLPELLEA